MARPMLDQLELQQVRRIEAAQDQVLKVHRVPGLETDFLQRLGRRAAAVELAGIISGAQAGTALKDLRDKFRAAEPVTFVADVATATRLQQVLIERLSVGELAGRPERFEYAIRIRELITPPAVETEEPPPEPPPKAPAEEVVDGVGTLVVQVTSEDASVDPEVATVTVAALPAGAGPPRTLAAREANVWTEQRLAAGEHVVEATVTDPATVAGSATVTVVPGQTSQVSVTLGAASVVAQQFVLHFTTDKAFVEPCMRRVLAEVVAHAAAHDKQKLLVIGHTDLVGSDAENQSLSERRARAVFAMLTRGRAPDASVAEWEALFVQRPHGEAPSMSDSWGLTQAQHMLQDLGFYPGAIDGEDGPLTREAVRAFRCRAGLPPGTTVDDDVFRVLIRAYLAQDAFALPVAQLLPNCPPDTLKWLGAGEKDPVRNVQTAWRPNRRVELLFLTMSTLPCDVPKPDTFDLPSPGAGGTGWCLDVSGSATDRTCFLAKAAQPCSAATPPRFCRPPAPATVAVTGTIQQEVRAADGSVSLKPFPNARFALYDPTGRIDGSEDGRGQAVPRRADAKGAFTIADRLPGTYVFELHESPARVVRLADTPDAPATGATVCKSIGSASDTLDVVVLATTATREIVLPTAVHVMTAIDPSTTPHEVRTCPRAIGGGTLPQASKLTDDQIRAAFAGSNRIWEQGRIRADVRDIVREAFPLPPRPTCEVDDADIAMLLKFCAYDGVLNVFFVGDLAGQTEAGGAISMEDALANGLPGGCFVSDRIAGILGVDTDLTDAEREQVLAHEIGHYLTLDHVTDVGWLMLTGTPAGANRLLVASEVAAARASAGAALECRPLRLTVTGAGRVGGSLSHEFIALQDPAAQVTVDVELPPALAALGTLTTTVGGTPAADPLHAAVPRSATGRTAVVATFTATAGGAPITARVEILVVSFTLTVDGARPSTVPDHFIVEPHITALVTVSARLVPEPFCVPEDLVRWTGGVKAPDPLQRTVSRVAPGSTTVTATLAGVTLTRTIDVVELALVTNVAPVAPVKNVVIEGILNEKLRDFKLTDLIGVQPSSVVRARVTGSSITINTITATLQSFDAAGAVIETISVNLTRTAPGAFQSLPILAVPKALPANDIRLATPKTIEVVRAQAGGRIRLESPLLPTMKTDVDVRGRVVTLVLRSLKSNSGGASSGISLADLNARLARADRVWAQAGVEIRGRTVTALVAVPNDLIDVAHTDDTGVSLTDDEKRLCGVPTPAADPADPPLSAVLSDLNVFYIRTMDGPPAGIAFPTHPVILLEGTSTPEALAHEIGHQILSAWGGDEHQDQGGNDWPGTNVMNRFDAGGIDVDSTQAVNILRHVAAGTQRFVRMTP